VSFTDDIHRYVEPAETLGEVLFGLIMMLTFTVGARFVAGEDGLDTHALIVGAVGCNLAWGVIDGTLSVLDSLFKRSRRARFFRALKRASSEGEALAALREEFGLEDEPLAIVPEDGARLYRSLLLLSDHAEIAPVGLRRRDFVTAFIVFVLVSATALPGVLPLLLVPDPQLALRVANFVLIGLLFVVGYWWAHYTQGRPWVVGTVVTILGASMVVVAVMLGG
jgi:VIT1/CCC1 family predicted Fe2+/Mn2+ transporter